VLTAPRLPFLTGGTGKAAYAAHGCVPQPGTGPPPRPLNLVVAPSAPWPPADMCRSEGLQPLCDTLAAIGAGREVYSDEKVANREIRVWHGATENGA
jgi:hypothetical protein